MSLIRATQLLHWFLIKHKKYDGETEGAENLQKVPSKEAAKHKNWECLKLLFYFVVILVIMFMVIMMNRNAVIQ